jgi:hypothetical protein
VNEQAPTESVLLNSFPIGSFSAEINFEFYNGRLRVSNQKVFIGSVPEGIILVSFGVILFVNVFYTCPTM